MGRREELQLNRDTQKAVKDRRISEREKIGIRFDEIFNFQNRVSDLKRRYPNFKVKQLRDSLWQKRNDLVDPTEMDRDIALIKNLRDEQSLGDVIIALEGAMRATNVAGQSTSDNIRIPELPKGPEE